MDKRPSNTTGTLSDLQLSVSAVKILVITLGEAPPIG